MRNTIAWPARPDGQPLCIAHRGASAHATENTLQAFRVAAALGADMWEIDVHLTADGQPVVIHDYSPARLFGLAGEIAGLSFAEIREKAPAIPCLREVLELARALGQALYIELKAPGSGRVAWALLQAMDFRAAGLGSFMTGEIRALADAGCPWPLSVLVPLGADPFECAALSRADIIHLCWEKGGERPQDLVTPELIGRARASGLETVLWHEERKSVLDDLQGLPVLGICTNQPELMRGVDSLPATGTELVCHRGANRFAPENTLAAARLSFDQGADYVELDVRLTADGAIVVMHDETLERTTNGAGRVEACTLAQLRTLSAGRWFSEFHAAEPVPTLEEMIDLAKSYGRKLYIENKSVDPALLVSLVESHGFIEDCFFWSPERPLLEGIRAASPGTRIKANLREYGSFEAMRQRLAPQIVEIGFNDFEDQAAACRAAGMVPMMQYFGDDPSVFGRIHELAPPMLNLDRADLFLAAARRRAAESVKHES